MMKRLNAMLGVIVVWAATGPGNPALAAAVSMVSFGNLRAELTDLDVADGVAPSLSFFSAGVFDNYVYAEVQGDSSVVSDHFGSTLFEPASRSAAAGAVSALASISGNGTLGGTFIQAAGMALGPGAFFSEVYVPLGEVPANFTLTPNTRLVVSGLVNASVQTTIGAGEAADAEVQLLLSGPSADGGPGFQNSFDEIGLALAPPAEGPGTPGGQSDALSDQLLSVSFVNATAAPMTGRLESLVFANGSSVVLPAIPEPGTAWLMLAGLLGLAMALRRTGRARRF